MKRGFSLVELSIVLVILGLLVGGILAGQSLIRASELRSISSDFTRYGTAMYAFRDKYFALPGDFVGATNFWGTASGGCPSGARTGTQTCNGNSNGAISQPEGILFWQHLANAGLVEGSYAGYGTAAAGTTVPRAKISGAYVSFPYDASGGMEMLNASSSTTYTPTYGKNGTISGSGDSCYGCGGVIKHEEAWNVDTKMDDGLANRGKLRAELYDNSANAATDSCSTYTLSNTTGSCIVSYQYFR